METKKRNYYYFKIIGYLSILVGLVLLISSIYNYYSTEKLINQSLVTNGIVVRNEVKGTGTLLQNVSYIKYFVGNTSYECHNTWRGGDFSFQVGDSVSIRYDVMNPQNAFVNDTNNLYWDSKGLIIVALFFLIIGSVCVFGTNFILRISKDLGAAD